MATSKKATPKKKVVAKKVHKDIKVSFQGVGSIPTELKLKSGTTLAEFIADKSLDDYVVSVNGNTNLPSETVLANNDVVRIGIKTKNA